MPGGLIRPIVAARDHVARWVTGVDPRAAIAVQSAEQALADATGGLPAAARLESA
jgi:hypothetical protein